MNKPKMQWMSDGLVKDNYNYRIQSTKKHMGTVCMPTGDGKSGVMIEDIFYHIKHTEGNIIINVSSPILKLNQQLIRDFLQVLDLMKVDTSEIRFFINSSDTGNNYSGLDTLDMDANPLSDFDRKHSRINIVASCHKSLYKFVDFIETKKDTYIIISYIDEAHLLPIATSNNNAEDSDPTDVNVRVDLDKLCKFSYAVYAFSATPDQEVTDTIIKYEPLPKGKSKYMIHIKARDSIQAGRILPPLVKYLRTRDTTLTVDDLKWIMSDAKASNPNIPHKVLVTCNSKKELKDLTDGLKDTYKVFSICSPTYGYEDFEHENIEEFSDMVENYPDDCFVLHVKMLTAGIDIKGLTDCVLFSRDHGKQEKYRKTIQTIGRVLRCLLGERGAEFVGSVNKKYSDSPRKKPYGGVYFISPIDDPSVESAIRGLVERYYGLECVVFERAYTKTTTDNGGINWIQDTSANPSKNSKTGGNADTVANEDPELYKLMMSVENTIKEKYETILNIPRRNNLPAYKAIKAECDSGLVKIPGEYDTVEWLTNTEITNFIYEKIPSLFEDVAGFDTYIWQSLVK